VALKRRQLSNVWLVPAHEPSRAAQITFGAGGYRGALAWTPDGRIVYASEEGSAATIAVMNADGSRPRQLLGERTGEGYPSGVAVSPDGRHVVYSSDAGGTRHLWRMKIDGGDAVQLTRGGGESQPAYSPDGRWIVFTRLETPDTGRPTVWKISADGGEPVRLTDAFSLSPAVSPDGKWVACFYSESVASPVAKIAVLPLDGGAPVRLLQTPIQNGLAVRWTRDGRHVTWAENHGATSRILTEPVEGGAARALAEFGAEQVFGFDWSPDGRRLAVVRGIWAMDAVVLKGF
jgi:Tol biopolymer transport system component